MIVSQFYINRITIYPGKANTKLLINPDHPNIILHHDSIVIWEYPEYCVRKRPAIAGLFGRGRGPLHILIQVEEAS